MVKLPLKMKKKDQISFYEQEARRLQAEFNEQDKLAKEKAQLIEDENLAWDNVQAMMDADYELATRAEDSSKRLGEGLKQESIKKQKVDDEQEAAELKRCLEIVPD
nr:hypothetical protein [Tanacetum cinerariifolium]